MADDSVTVLDWTSREIRALRLARRMTVEEFAAHLGVSARTVTRWERAHAPRHPRLVNQAALDTSLHQADQGTRERFARHCADHRSQMKEEGQ